MTSQTVFNEVAALCTEGVMDNEDGFFAALNRALSEVNALCPSVGETLFSYDGNPRGVSLAEVAPNGRRFLAVLKEDGRPFSHREGYMNETQLTLFHRRACVYRLRYEKGLRAIDAANRYETLEVCASVQHLVVLLTAYYVCVEDENPKAEAFLLRYREALSEWERRRPTAEEAGVVDRYGW